MKRSRALPLRGMQRDANTFISTNDRSFILQVRFKLHSFRQMLDNQQGL